MNKEKYLYGSIIIAIAVISLISTQISFVKISYIDNNSWDYYGKTVAYTKGIDKTELAPMIALYLLPVILLIFGGLILTNKMLQSTRIWLPMVGVAGLVMAIYTIQDLWGVNADSSIALGGYLCLATYLASITCPLSPIYPKYKNQE